jgi:uncharacterized repeat protein (TIGR01451 family)
VTISGLPTSLASGQSANVTLSYTAPASGGVTVNSGIGTTTSQGANAAPDSASGSTGITPTLTPSLAKSFSPSTINDGGTTTLTFTITNPAPNNPTQVVGFTDMLPSGLKIAAVPNIGGTCSGGTVTAAAGGTSITVAGRNVPASTASPATCTVTVDVTNVIGVLNASCANNPAAFTNGTGNITGLSNLIGAVTPSCVAVNGNTFSVLKAPSASSLVTGSLLTYTITVTNNGPSSANGSLLTDPAVAGFVASSINCTNATNGAVCPAAANVTLANLQGPGIALPTFPANSTLTFALNGTFTQSAGSVVNTATISSPPGLPPQTQSSSATVTVQTVGPAIIPTTNERVLLTLVLILALAGGIYARRLRR